MSRSTFTLFFFEEQEGLSRSGSPYWKFISSNQGLRSLLRILFAAYCVHDYIPAGQVSLVVVSD